LSSPASSIAPSPSSSMPLLAPLPRVTSITRAASRPVSGSATSSIGSGWAASVGVPRNALPEMVNSCASSRIVS
jgi:hypothetical protein